MNPNTTYVGTCGQINPWIGAFELVLSSGFTTTKTLICPGWETPVVPVSQPETLVRDKRGALLFRLVTPTGTKGAASAHVAGAPFCPGWCYQPGQNVLFCPGCQARDKRAPPFVPDWHSRLGNRDNRGLPTGTNQRFCSSDMIHQMKIKLNLILVLLKLIVHRENT